MRFPTVLLAVAVGMLLLAPAASADDESVFRAWTHENTTLAKLEKALGKNLKTWSDSGAKKGDPALERISKIRALLARRKKAVTGEDPSTGDGGSGRKNALASLRDYDAAMLRLRSAVRAGMDGKGKAARTYLGQYETLIDRSGRYEKRARAAFEAAGVA